MRPKRPDSTAGNALVVNVQESSKNNQNDFFAQVYDARRK